MEIGAADNLIGRFRIQGNYTQRSGGTLAIDVFGTGAGSGHDQLAITGAASLEGRLNVDRQNFAPLADTTYRILSYGSLTKEAWVVALPAPTSNVQFTKTTSATSIDLAAIPSPPVYVYDAVAEEGDSGSVGGPGRTMDFTIRGLAPFGGITVNYATSGGAPGVDYTPLIGSFTITQSGAYSQVVSVSLLGNQKLQADRLFNLQATAEGLTPHTGQGLILDDDAPTSMTLSGEYATATTNAAFSPKPSATVRNKHNHAVEGATVQMSVFAATGGQTATFPDGSGFATATTTAAGVAEAALTANGVLGGPYTLSFRTLAPDGTTAANGVMALRNVGAPIVLVVSGNGQLAPATTAFAEPFRVKVVNAAGAGIAGVTVTFAAPATGASGSFAGGVTTAVTDITGVATSPAFTANATTGTYAVTASATGYATASFTVTNQNALRPLEVVSGAGQSASVAAAFANPIKVRAVDLSGNPVGGVIVTFSLPTSGASGSLAGGVVTATTGSDGVATSPTITANTVAGSFVMTASVAGSLPVTAALTNTAAAPAAVATVSGGGQTATVETAYANPLKARVTDAYGNPVPGATVTFAVPTSGASLRFAGGVATATTGADGVATSAAMTANTAAGGLTVSASAPGSSPASFSLTNAAAAASALVATGGGGQTATVATAFGQPLRVRATDAYGNPVPGVTVTFAAPASGPSATFAGGVFTAVTGADGVATSATVSATTAAGGYTITAAASGVAAVSYSLTNTAGAAASLAVAGGASQTARVGTAFASRLLARATDAYGNPVAGVTVTFAAPTTGASATFARGVAMATTDASGVATSGELTANGTAGGYQITATAGALGAITYPLTNAVFAVAGLDVLDASSIRIRFNDEIATAGLQVSEVSVDNVLLEEADITIRNAANETVRGSLVVAADRRSATFVKSGSGFAAGGYSARLRSAASGFTAVDGSLLDGDSNGQPGGDYTGSFTIAAAARTLGLPDVVRGPGQDLRTSATVAGLPVTISEGQGVYAFSTTITYDPALLTIGELVVADAAAARLSITYNTAVPGRIDVVGIAPAGLDAGAQTLFFVRGSVPNQAVYGSLSRLGMSDVSVYRLDGTTFTAAVDGGLAVTAYPGDVTGEGRYTAVDALRMQRYLVNLESAFAGHPLVDPMLIGDVSGDGRLTSLDSLLMQRYLVNIAVPTITPPPVATVVQAGAASAGQTSLVVAAASVVAAEEASVKPAVPRALAFAALA